MKNYKKMITYYIFNKIHRENGPAHVSWYKNGQKMYDMYYINGEYHREDGPAIEYANDDKEWWLDGEDYTEEEFIAKTRPTKELTIAEVEKLLGYQVKIVK